MLAEMITDHVIQAKKRLLTQYQNQPKINALVESLVQEIQTLEQTCFDLDSKRQLYQAQGVQLDLLGEIVGMKRNGLQDQNYLYFILGKIGENFSDGTIPKITSIIQVILNAKLSYVRDLYPASVGVSGGSKTIDPSLYSILKDLITLSLGAAISLSYLSLFDSDLDFAFFGNGGLGFNSVSTPDHLGGGMAFLIE